MGAEGLNGGEVLRDLRRRYRVSQAQLSAISGVSERTVRNLENRTIVSPRTSTLMAMASALELPPAEVEELLRAWDDVRVGPPFAEASVGQQMHAAMREQLLRSFLDKRVVVANRLIRVGANKLITEEFYQTTIEALNDGVDTHSVLARRIRDHQDMDRLHFNDLVGCSVKRRRLDREVDMLIVDFDLGRELRLGETMVIAWREVNGWAADQQPGGHGPVDERYTNAFMRPITALSMQVVFECEPPTSAWQLMGRERLDRTEELAVNAYNSVSTSWVNARPGRFGIGWTWD